MVEPRATQLRGYDLVVLVKRQRSSLLRDLHDARARIIWDVVDAWPQPDGNQWPADMCRSWLRDEIKDIKPHAIVAATKVMAGDCREFFSGPILALPHHCRPKMPVNPIRDRVTTVGYEGRDYYLGRWADLVNEQCRRRGWRFVLNPPALAEVDIVVAFRDCSGYAARKWKSNVKLANAQGTGTPCVLNREAGYVETAVGGVEWADEEDELALAFDKLAPVETRRKAAQELLASAPTLKKVAATYKSWLDQLSS